MAGGTPKPFACTSEGCTMTFTNEDHLNVHQRKHEMVLNLGSKNTNIVADQTPTPTRFLRNCEEVGLFQDLQNVNPFEETFKRAVEMAKTGSLPVPDLPEDDTLHTPHVFPHMPEENVSCIYNSQPLKPESAEININRIVALTVKTIDEKGVIETTTINNSNSPDHLFMNINSEKTPTILINDKPSISVNDSCGSTLEAKKETNKPTRKRKTPINEKKPVGKHCKITNETDENNVNKVSAKQKLQQKIQTKQLKSAENANIAQSVIYVPNLKIANSDTDLAMVPVLHSISSKLPILPKVNTNPLVVTTQNAVTDVTIVPVLQTVSSELPVLPKVQSITTQNTISVAAVNNNNISNNNKVNKVCDLTDKRIDLLERNRAAATRSRAKKKEWIVSLQSKYNNVIKENKDLQIQNASLEAEVKQLKSLLLAHKDCPVTKAMHFGQNISIGLPTITIQVPALTEEELNKKITSMKTQNTKHELNSKTSVIVLNDSLIS